MSSPHLPELIRIYREDLPEIQSRVENASTHMTLWPATKKLFNLTALLLRHVILESYDKVSPAELVPAAPPAPPAPPAPLPMRAYAPAFPAGLALPPPPLIDQPGTAPVALSNQPNMPDIEPDKTNVFITANGTKVIPPAGRPTMTLPPGQPIDIPSLLAPPVPPPAPPGVAQVILPPGGGMSPDVAAALAGRSQESPPGSQG